MTTRTEVTKPKLLLIRGAPGSGKTTIANTLYPEWVSCCANDLFVDDDGNFKIDFSLLNEAHKQCYLKCKTNLSEGKNVVVHNTFKKLQELNQYLRLSYLADIKIYRVVSQFDSIHHIPEKIVTKYLIEYESHTDDILVKLNTRNNKLVFYENDKKTPFHYSFQQKIVSIEGNMVACTDYQFYYPHLNDENNCVAQLLLSAHELDECVDIKYYHQINGVYVLEDVRQNN